MRVLIVDDSVLYRQVLHTAISNFDEVNDVHVAASGSIALRKAAQLQPDIITLDIEMPGIDGLQVLQKLREQRNHAPVIIISAHTKSGIRSSVKALEQSAIEIVAKPQGLRPEEAIKELSSILRPIIQAFSVKTTLGVDLMKSGSTKLVSPNRLQSSTMQLKIHPDVIAIGASTGGPAALIQLLGSLPSDLAIPILIVVHLPKGFSSQVASTLNKKCSILVLEGKQNVVLKQGTAYVAPAGKQMGVGLVRGKSSVQLIVTDDPPENHCRPSADYLFRSVARVYGSRSLGVILTGMGRDGTRGLMEMKRQGAFIIAQDRESSIVFGMPAEAIQAGVVDLISPLNRIAKDIQNYLER